MKVSRVNCMISMHGNTIEGTNIPRDEQVSGATSEKYLDAFQLAQDYVRKLCDANTDDLLQTSSSDALTF